MSVYDFVIARLKEERNSLPIRHWWHKYDSDHRAISQTIQFVEKIWHTPGSALTTVHTLKLMARQYRSHPDYRPVWDSNDWFLA